MTRPSGATLSPTSKKTGYIIYRGSYVSILFSKKIRHDAPQYAYWLYGKPNFEAHKDLEVVFKDTYSTANPKVGRNTLASTVDRFHESLAVYKKQAATWHFRVSFHKQVPW